MALDQYFEKEEIAGRQLAVLDIGPCTLPTGKLLVRDPLVYLGRKNEQPYLRTAPAVLEVVVVEVLPRVLLFPAVQEGAVGPVDLLVTDAAQAGVF